MICLSDANALFNDLVLARSLSLARFRWLWTSSNDCVGGITLFLPRERLLDVDTLIEENDLREDFLRPADELDDWFG